MLPVVTLRLAVCAAATAVLAPFVAVRWVVLVDGVLAVAATVDWLRAPRPERVDVGRDAPDVLTRGMTGRLVWTVTNPTRRHLRVALADELVDALGAPTRRTTMTVPPGGRARRGVDLTPQRRGRFVLERVTLRVTGPWGLAARQRWRPLRHVLTVYPPFRSQAQTELRLQRARQLQLGERTVRMHGGGMEFDTLRDYTVDDEVRRIDWAATARSPHAIVRTYQAERNQTVLLLVDCGRTMAALVGADPAVSATAVADAPGGTEGLARLEHAIDAAQAVTRLVTGMGDRVGMIAFADRVLATVPPRNQTDQLRHVTAQLSVIEPRLVESDYRAAFANALGRFPRRSLLIVLTELASEAATQTLLPALGLVRRRHLAVVAAVVDPVVERWRTAAPRTVEHIYRRAAAIRALDQRAATAAQLRAVGVTVIDAVPGGLAAALCDTYLDTKAAGRL
ncbi:MAG: DUF58 domain-containing protein [Actinobacteria bacterium]|nr:DUF58 domain-containing protein [Actinomycetota bacterium]